MFKALYNLYICFLQNFVFFTAALIPLGSSNYIEISKNRLLFYKTNTNQIEVVSLAFEIIHINIKYNLK